jgi:hypothetical protein
VSTGNGFDRSSPIMNCGKEVANVVNIMSMNVCDLVSKMKYNEFISEIQKYIISITESKIDATDIIDIPGYIVFTKHRRELSHFKFGGIVIFIREFFIEYFCYEVYSQRNGCGFKVYNGT